MKAYGDSDSYTLVCMLFILGYAYRISVPETWALEYKYKELGPGGCNQDATCCLGWQLADAFLLTSLGLSHWLA